MPKKIMCAFGTDIDSVAGQIGSYAGGDSPSDIQRGIFATEVGVPRLLRLFEKFEMIFSIICIKIIEDDHPQ